MHDNDILIKLQFIILEVGLYVYKTSLHLWLICFILNTEKNWRVLGGEMRMLLFLIIYLLMVMSSF